MGKARKISPLERRNLYQQRKADHRCVFCGKALPEGSTLVTCPGCTERKRATQRDKSRRLTLAAKLLGACRYHPNREAIPGTTRCAVCAERHDEWQVQWRARKRQEAESLGLCLTCFHNPTEPGRKQCPDCTTIGRERRARYRRNQQLKATGEALAKGKKVAA